ncbi:phosphate signaling complex protein PhoU [Streptomyces adustus]
MREAYHGELASIGASLVEMARLADSAMGRATTALLDADGRLAQSVISADERVDDVHRDLENRAIALLARQQPVATELRIVVTSLRIGADLERAADLAEHVAKLARRRFPDYVVPRDLQSTMLEMGRTAQRLMTEAADVVASRDVGRALQLERDDDRMDELHRTLFQHLLDERWEHGVEAAVDVTLAGRYYERFADHAVSVARRVVYLVTGEYADELTPPVVPLIVRA